MRHNIHDDFRIGEDRENTNSSLNAAMCPSGTLTPPLIGPQEPHGANGDGGPTQPGAQMSDVGQNSIAEANPGSELGRMEGQQSPSTEQPIPQLRAIFDNCGLTQSFDPFIACLNQEITALTQVPAAIEEVKASNRWSSNPLGAGEEETLLAALTTKLQFDPAV